MIAAVFIRRLREDATFEDFIREWEADRGYGVPTRVINAPSLEDPREILSIGFIDVDAELFAEQLAKAQDPEAVRHERIDSVIESTSLRSQFEVRSEHDFSADPREIALDSVESLFAVMRVDAV